MLAAAVVAAEVTRHILLPEVPEVLAEVQTEAKAQLDQTQLLTQAVAVVVAVTPEQDLMAVPAAPASSSCRTQWPLALRSRSNPRQRGLRLLARPRLTISLLPVAAVVQDSPLAAVPVGFVLVLD